MVCGRMQSLAPFLDLLDLQHLAHNKKQTDLAVNVSSCSASIHAGHVMRRAFLMPFLHIGFQSQPVLGSSGGTNKTAMG